MKTVSKHNSYSGPAYKGWAFFLSASGGLYE